MRDPSSDSSTPSNALELFTTSGRPLNLRPHASVTGPAFLPFVVHFVLTHAHIDTRCDIAPSATAKRQNAEFGTIAWLLNTLTTASVTCCVMVKPFAHVIVRRLLALLASSLLSSCGLSLRSIARLLAY